MVLQAIKYLPGKLEILDQLKLPHQEIYLEITSPEEAWDAIKSMQVRGAPAIAIVAILSLAVWGANYIPPSPNSSAQDADGITQFLSDKLKYLVTSRPTAVNLGEAAARLDSLVWNACGRPGATGLDVIEAYIKAAEQMLVDDVKDNENIGRHGAEWILQKARANKTAEKISVLTHCNTGSLATAGYGTALGVIRSLHSSGSLLHAYYTETRPYNQGSRLTGYELLHDKIPATLVTDSMAGALLCREGSDHEIAAVIVGADRVAANGDTANKIGTYSLAILARYHKVKFVVAAPRTTIDLKTKGAAGIEIEQRPQTEVTRIKGPPIQRLDDGQIKLAIDRGEEISTAAEGTQAWNPAFDVTPAELIDAIVTEVGVAEKDKDGKFDLSALF